MDGQGMHLEPQGGVLGGDRPKLDPVCDRL